MRTTALAIGASVALLASLAVWDEKQEAKTALEEFAEDQAVVARSLAAQLETRLREVRKDAARFADSMTARKQSTATLAGYLSAHWRPSDEPPEAEDVGAIRFSVNAGGDHVVDLVASFAELTSRLAAFEQPSHEVILLLPPREVLFRTLDGRRVPSAPIAVALRRGNKSVQLSREEAAALGLPERLAVAGLAAVDAGDLGRWDVAYVVSAKRLRDRDQRARFRLVLGVLATGGLVMVFGALALRRQRRELELRHELTVAAVERDHEQRLDNANRAATLGTLAMGIAHELATPASVIRGRAEQLLERHPEDSRSVSALHVIVNQADGITEVVRGFLDLARGDSPASGEVKLAGLIDSAFDLVEHRFAKARVALSMATPPPDLPTVVGDSRLLEHALVNLLLNACDACEVGGNVVVMVALADDNIEISVIDDGHGISAENVAHVRRPFFTTKAAGKGTGLGLAISTEIVRAHRGELRLTPRRPRGTIATIVLPAHGAST